MKTVGVNSAVCFLVCCMVAWTISASVISDALGGTDDHPVLNDILKYAVSYFNSPKSAIKPPGIEKLIGTIFGNDTWEVNVSFYYRHKNTDCNAIVKINDESVHLDKLLCTPVVLSEE
ncbi:hypothetical protein RUM44_012168 [Polyplax serrata]|uniref:Uncharacterized protein n=1 Tax=Polyplax serrata TaxID=468196 RepID=A0ABR1BAI1_POLSC